MNEAPTQTLGSRERHAKERLAVLAEACDVSRETLRQVRFATRHADLAEAMAAGTLTALVAYRIAREREGLTVPSRRCNVSAENATDAIRVLLNHFTGDQLLVALVELGAVHD